MFSKSRNNRHRCIGDRAAADRLRDRRYRRERDPMLNSVLNGDWSNSVPGRQIKEGHVVTGDAEEYSLVF